MAGVLQLNVQKKCVMKQANFGPSQVPLQQ